MHALAATGAAIGITPWLIQVGDDAAVDAAAEVIPGVCSFDLIAYAHATRAKHTAVVVDNEAAVGCIYLELWIQIRNPHMRDPEAGCQRLQFAVTIRNADGADVVALGEEHLDNDFAQRFQSR